MASRKTGNIKKKSSSSSLKPATTTTSVMDTQNSHSSLSKAAATVTAEKRRSLRPSKNLKKNQEIKGKESVVALRFLIVVSGIYGSFLTWALLQERLTTTPYGSTTSPEFFKFPVFLNTIQSLFAASVGYAYLRRSGGKKDGPSIPPIFPNRQIIIPLLLVAITSSLASPFGYASLSHIDYITFILAKSCKLLPVMFLNITVFRKSYPLYKYLVIFAVTAGVAIFTLYATSPKKASKRSTSSERNSSWGLFLLGVNLLFDGLTNTTQDYIFQTFQPYTGPQMMCANNIISSVLTLSYLFFSPYLSVMGIGEYLGLNITSSSGSELTQALAFMAHHPKVWADVLGFAICGAIGQIFIFYTLSTFSSLLLVTITLTRKMLTMILSVIWFGHKLVKAQWIGVGLVFGGIGAETIIARLEKVSKAKEQKTGSDKNKTL
ncbi:UDP-galactose transporter-like protein 1 [Erysiphe neolycopersici]|uniref:UDP-galactose transporter homolog 1 n=1 Tax=Erysiphe neolycopersici TaxID=212602 RepID=A0A420HNM1_9PEZI|nr:UDP-galactose transporter-like protein 1 [Erysiphe neolycopersici]